MNIIDLPTTESAIRESYEVGMKMAANLVDFDSPHHHNSYPPSPPTNNSVPESPQSSCDDCCTSSHYYNNENFQSPGTFDCLECGDDGEHSSTANSNMDGCLDCIESEKDHQNGVKNILDDLLQHSCTTVNRKRDYYEMDDGNHYHHHNHHHHSHSNNKLAKSQHHQNDDNLYCHWDDHLHSHYEMKFNSQMELDNHLRSVHDVYNNHFCQWDSCDVSASTIDDILSHIRRDHIPNNSTTNCHDHHHHESNTPTHNNSRSSSINPSMTPDEVLQCHYNNCEYTALNSVELNTHLTAYHQINNNQSMPTPNHTPIDSHHHINPYQCEWNTCKFESKYYDDIISHIQSVHNKHNNNNELPSPVHTDEEQHQPQNKHICHWVLPDGEECLHEHSSTQELSDHVINDHIGSKKNEYKCMWKGCERECRPFRQRQKVIRHLQTHSKNRPHKCTICGNSFAEMAVLKQHMRVHSGEKPYACKLCGKRFAASTALSVHNRTHTGEKPLLCKYPGCGRRFAESSNLTKHMKTHYKAASKSPQALKQQIKQEPQDDDDE